MSESLGSPMAPMDVTGIAAPLLFGSLINWALYGALCVQIFVYSYNFPRDRRSTKFLAYFVFLLESVQTALTGTDAYYLFVGGIGDMEHLQTSTLPALDIPIFLAIISFIVQGQFCYRIWTLNRRSSWICCIIAVAAVTQSVAATFSGIQSLVAGRGYVISKTNLYLWSISSALADVLITLAMTLLLRRASGQFIHFVLLRVVRLTIETNALTGTSLGELFANVRLTCCSASLAMTVLALYVAFPHSLYFVSITQILGKVYSNTFLVCLNNRIYLREHGLRVEHCSCRSSNRIRAAASSPMYFTEPDLQPGTIGDSLELCTITQTAGPGEGKDVHTSNKASPSTISRTLPDDLERAVEEVPTVNG